MAVVIPDISNNNMSAASENWTQVRTTGANAAGCKASEGTNFIDYTFGPNWTQMHRAGLQARIAYHFAHPSQSAQANAVTYLQAVAWGAGTGGPMGSLDRRALDLEVMEGQTPSQVVQWSLAWEQATRAAGGARPLLYTYEAYLRWLGPAADALVPVFDLWVAAYQQSPPDPTPWPSWSLWQFTDAGDLPGINGRCDLSEIGPNFFKARPLAPPAAYNHLNAAIVGGSLLSSGAGYRLVGGDGGVFDFQADYLGSTGSVHLNAPMVGMDTTPSGRGYWLVASDGGVFSFGDAVFHGSTGGQHLNAPIVGLAATPSGNGYWLAGADGGVFTFGDAVFQGSLGSLKLNAGIVGIASSTVGGYYLVGADGGVFTFGVPFHGSAAATKLNARIVGISSAPGAAGYLLAAADGGVFTFGVPFRGSMANVKLNAPIVGVDVTPNGQGYLLWAADGGVFTFGSAVFHGAI